MAIFPEKMAFSQIWSSMDTSHSFHLLYHRNDVACAGERVPLHQHRFWQIEIIREGTVRLEADGQSFLLRKGDWCLLPPESGHAWRYESETRYLSFKFEADSASVHTAAPRARSPVLKRIADLLAELLPEGEVTPDRSRPLEPLLALALDEWQRRECEGAVDAPRLRGNSDLPMRALRLVEEGNGKIASVKMLAEQLRCSANYLSAEYRRRKGKSLKRYIDFVRLRRAKTMLLYSERRIGDIATALHFNDVYAFSRFFRRTSGQSPRGFRRQT